MTFFASPWFYFPLIGCAVFVIVAQIFYCIYVYSVSRVKSDTTLPTLSEEGEEEIHDDESGTGDCQCTHQKKNLQREKVSPKASNGVRQSFEKIINDGLRKSSRTRKGRTRPIKRAVSESSLPRKLNKVPPISDSIRRTSYSLLNFVLNYGGGNDVLTLGDESIEERPGLSEVASPVGPKKTSLHYSARGALAKAGQNTGSKSQNPMDASYWRGPDRRRYFGGEADGSEWVEGTENGVGSKNFPSQSFAWSLFSPISSDKSGYPGGVSRSDIFKCVRFKCEDGSEEGGAEADPGRRSVPRIGPKAAELLFKSSEVLGNRVKERKRKACAARQHSRCLPSPRQCIPLCVISPCPSCLVKACKLVRSSSKCKGGR